MRLEMQPMLMGMFRVESGQLRVTDPCYCPTPREGHGGALEHGKGILLLPALNGTWFLRAHLFDDGPWGVRTGKLEAFHESYFNHPLPQGEPRGKMYVDSGQMGVFDEAHFPRDPDEFEYMTEGCFYKRACDLVYDHAQDRYTHGGCMDFGGVTSTGFGDGAYPASVYTDGTGLAVSIAVEFIAEDDEDFGDDDDDYDDDEDEESEDDDDDEEDEPDDE